MSLFLSSAKKAAVTLCAAAGLCLSFAAVARASSNTVDGAGEAVMRRAAVTHVTVTFRVEGNGTLTVTVDGNRIASGAQVSIEKSILFTAVPDEGYVIAHWTVNGDKDFYPASSYKISMSPQEDAKELYDVVVSFERASPAPATVTFGAGPEGTLTAAVDDAPLASGDSVGIGKNVVFTAVPDEGYGVAGWTVEGAEVVDSSSAHTRVVRISNEAANVEVTASFEWTSTTHAKVTFGAGPEGTLIATVDGAPIASGALVGIGKDVVFTVVSIEGYAVVHWMINETEVVDSSLLYTLALPISSAAAVDVAASFEIFSDPPVKRLYGVVKIGPIPVRAGGDVAIYWDGNKAVRGCLSVFDAVGEKIANVDVNGIQKIGTWKPGGIARGAYLIKGVLQDKDGFKVKVSRLVGVVR